ncbi:hypothetical protein TGME49_233153 [Toxoplasma gondii ME49]|uniref:Uncharacterized protein n=3 Tax=Toxoplasma gondii TaxID=5811 RepID=A0A125YWV8_TOXGV|nr:hypothetical protein TGME49_233153 [Toxoplasma gondii ME49]EPT28795.1 hypothetical protein TGME49_233153 [Toxoplasma gondii ME49]ESS35870.1 hypothetical protein TGVEG_233153 [Toxoplasma gondii VEG]KYF46283.1 hypothetical protein TGARI_233153 [Toxoplasma gondii ARI]|eukprot:XP_018636791.1 hypothetical protein TGME49_233153 [Toxoplasma gondii ME49]
MEFLLRFATYTPRIVRRRCGCPIAAQATEAVRERLRAEHVKEELKGCTFRPKILHSRISTATCSSARGVSDSLACWASLSKYILPEYQKHDTKEPLPPGSETTSQGNGQKKRAWSCEERRRISRGEVLYLEGKRQLETQQQTFEHIRALRREAELQECTFAPAVHSPSKPTVGGAAVKPAGFDSSVARVRQATERREERLKLQEIRDPSIPARAGRVHRRNTLPQPFSFEEGRYKVKLAPEVFTMTVEIGRGRRGKMSIREGEDPRLVARSFCKTYSLQGDEAEWITGVLLQEMSHRNLLAFTSVGPDHFASPVARNPTRAGSPGRDSSRVRIVPACPPQSPLEGGKVALEDLDQPFPSLQINHSTATVEGPAVGLQSLPGVPRRVQRIPEKPDTATSEARSEQTGKSSVPSFVSRSLSGDLLAPTLISSMKPSPSPRQKAPPNRVLVGSGTCTPILSARKPPSRYALEEDTRSQTQKGKFFMKTTSDGGKSKGETSAVPAREVERRIRRGRGGDGRAAERVSEFQGRDGKLTENSLFPPNNVPVSALPSMDLSRPLHGSTYPTSLVDEDYVRSGSPTLYSVVDSEPTESTSFVSPVVGNRCS